MADNDNEIKTSARLIVELLTNPNFAKSEDSRLQAQLAALNGLAKGNKDSIESILHDVRVEAPLTFNKLWPTAFGAIQDYGNNPDGAIQRLGLLLGWAYIETVWNAQVTGRTSWALNGAELASLAAIQMGLPEHLNEKDSLTAIFTHSTLISSLLMNRFEQSVKGGLEKINGMETRLSGWEQRLNATEDLTNNAEAKINAYNETLKKYEVAFGFLGMATAYKNFFGRKKTERNLFGIALVLLFIAILVIPFVSFNSSEKSVAIAPEKSVAIAPEKSVTVSLENNTLWLFLKYSKFAALILLLIYFFRVVLLHFNSTQAQLLQADSRMKCNFE
ncbi:MAG: hypothetical protein HY016_00800 [Nitrosomonadales bacterium]|nr:hypothetical protein [Nitrosomonadales bacterium]